MHEEARMCVHVHCLPPPAFLPENGNSALRLAQALVHCRTRPDRLFESSQRSQGGSPHPMSTSLAIERELYVPGDVVRVKISVKDVREGGVTWVGMQVGPRQGSHTGTHVGQPFFSPLFSPCSPQPPSTPAPTRTR